MKKTLATFIALATLSANALDFKGLEIGKPTTYQEVKDKLGSAIFCSSKGCSGPTTIAGEATKSTAVVFDENLIVKSIVIRIEPKQFDKVAEALASKYKKPQVAKEVLKTRMGVEVQNVSMTWKVDKYCEVFTEKYSGSIDQSVVLYQCVFDHDIEKAKEKEKSSKKDL